jgi:hypothetical protein
MIKDTLTLGRPFSQVYNRWIKETAEKINSIENECAYSTISLLIYDCGLITVTLRMATDSTSADQGQRAHPCHHQIMIGTVPYSVCKHFGNFP